MTAEEAIKKIDEVLSSDLHYDETLGYHLTSDDFEWLKKAKQALEKQIAIKPEKRHSIEFRDGYNDGNCSVCGAAYSDCLSDTPLFCSQCGQLFDWGENSE